MHGRSNAASAPALRANFNQRCDLPTSASGGALCRPHHCDGPATRSMAVPWRERPRDLAALAIMPAAREMVAHATLSLPQPERWSSESRRPAGVKRLQIRVVNSGRRAGIVRLATRALKALRASLVSLRPRCARLTALTARAASRSGQLSTAAAEVLDDGQRRRYCLIIFAGCDSRPPPHRPMWSTFESAVSGHGSFPTSQATSWFSVRATSCPRNRRPNRTALRPQARRRSARATPIEIIALPRRHACQTSMRQEPHPVRPFPLRTNRRHRRSEWAGVSWPKDDDARTGRGRRHRGRARAKDIARSTPMARTQSLRAFVRALARQAARECFELELKQQSRTIQ